MTKNHSQFDETSSTRKLLIFTILFTFFSACLANYLLKTYNFNHFLNNSKTCDTYTGSLTPPQIPPFQWKKTGVITLWFDDEWLSQFTTAVPLMKAMGFKGALSIAVKFICMPHFMTWDHMHQLQNEGWETTSHSVTHHCDLTYYNTQTIQKELVESQQIIKAHGLRADHFVMPCGYSRYDITVYSQGHNYLPIVENAAKYYASYRTTNDNTINPLPVVNPYNIKSFEPRFNTPEEKIAALIDFTKQQKGWLVLTFHQIDDSGQMFAVTPEKFKRILSLIKQSNLPVVLPTQALAIGQS